MSEEFKYDPFEYAKALAEGEDLGRSDLSEDVGRGLTRRDLLVKGGVGAAAIGGLGAIKARLGNNERLVETDQKSTQFR